MKSVGPAWKLLGYLLYDGKFVAASGFDIVLS
jgi:hypothetical protein